MYYNTIQYNFLTNTPVKGHHCRDGHHGQDEHYGRDGHHGQDDHHGQDGHLCRDGHHGQDGHQNFAYSAYSVYSDTQFSQVVAALFATDCFMCTSALLQTVSCGLPCTCKYMTYA